MVTADLVIHGPAGRTPDSEAVLEIPMEICEGGHQGGVFYVRAWPAWDPDGHTKPWRSPESESERNMIHLAGQMAASGEHASVEVFHTGCEEAIWSWSA